MLIYLDNCCFNRPYDDQGRLSIYLETQAKLAIQDLVDDNFFHLAWSFILDYENGANPDKSVAFEIYQWRNKAQFIVTKSKKLVSNALELTILGLGKKDSLHIASSISAGADYFITVDKGILRKKHLVKNLAIISPIDFIKLLEGNLL